jgi:flagellar hook-length control protein FliK
VTELTAQKLSDLLKKPEIQTALAQLRNDTDGQNLPPELAALVSLFLPQQPQPQTTPTILLAQESAQKTTGDGASAAFSQTPSPSQAEALNALEPGAMSDNPDSGSVDAEPSTFEKILSLMQGSGDGDSFQIQKKISALLDFKPPAPPVTPIPVMPSFLPSGLSGSDGFSDQFDPSASLLSSALTGPGQTASAASGTVLHTPQAGSLHPATQMVAIAMARSAAAGESKTINLQLDPPELGKMQIKLMLAKDRSIQAHMIVEKPETYSLMQRDSHALERSLHEMGLTTGPDGITFELAGQGSDFNQGSEGWSGENGSGNGKDQQGDSPLDILETTLSWSVDPDTGYPHYSLWV